MKPVACMKDGNKELLFIEKKSRNESCPCLIEVKNLITETDKSVVFVDSLD